MDAVHPSTQYPYFLSCGRCMWILPAVTNSVKCLHFVLPFVVWIVDDMPEKYHLLPQEFRNMYQVPTEKDSTMFPMAPDFTLLGDSVSKDPLFCSNLYSLSDPATFDSHLLPRVPSPSLPLEEMLRMWPSGQEHISSSTDKECGVYHLQTRRDSVTTLMDFGEWVLGQSYSRASSLLPPAPLFYRGRPSHLDPNRVDCDLLSAPSGTETCPEPGLQAASSQGATPEHLSRPPSHSHEARVNTGNASSSYTRPTTPVPSLSHSHNSSSSLSTIEQTYQVSKAASNSPGRVVPVDRSGASMHNSKTDEWITNAFGMRPSDEIDYTLPNLLVAQPPAHQPEVSYIEWDDGDGARAKSRLARMKKSFADLRAAERYISEAYTSSKTPLLKHKNDSPGTSRAAVRATTDEGTSEFSIQKQLEPRNDDHGEWKPLIPKPLVIGNVDTPAKLRKQSSTKSLLKKAAKPGSPITGDLKRDQRRTVSSGLEEISPLSQVSVEPGLTSDSARPSVAAPSSTRKRKRFGTVFDSPIRHEKKPARLSVIGKWLRRVLGLKRESKDWFGHGRLPCGTFSGSSLRVWSSIGLGRRDWTKKSFYVTWMEWVLCEGSDTRDRVSRWRMTMREWMMTDDENEAPCSRSTNVWDGREATCSL